MASMLARNAFRAAPRLRAPVQRRFISEAAAADRQASKDALKAGAKRDPELYILLAIMSGAFGLAGWYFASNPTSSSSERSVYKAPGSEPWNEGGSGKYQYHPGGDPNAPKKDAPSALNVVILPNVTLPKELHDQYNKWGKDGY
ncbi:hypothetical protein BU24DRAFT_404868 [Aaosphaeria arxii CBS 175.79]|uniref:Uncharacterized protein n=1 Tax=Aaosphaeria arxii CBS 175.79 TaxID=1450172 RepID=A0A6A5Y8K7_9PLEO|nr:uncharacterized protein BU24DRAFT_404868 [Aaosphaeria arxii CBS 175.79]KAF2021932.1 hypothetical protein BU24DRAFT_404868 [Aaosphaeria arxii CBS 175.79]